MERVFNCFFRIVAGLVVVGAGLVLAINRDPESLLGFVLILGITLLLLVAERALARRLSKFKL